LPEVERMFMLLRALELEKWQSAKQVSKRSGIPLVTTYAQLRKLEAIDVVEKQPKSYLEGEPHNKKTYGWRRTIIFRGERRVDKW